jgi:Type I phosphodiesterase / nucleotide pyrophosphatase
MFTRSAAALALSLVASGVLLPAAAAAPVHPPDRADRHVLLVSVDGLHASDLSQWVSTHPGSHLAQLSRRGTTFSEASTSEPSDSFPGLIAMVTGGSPKTTGIFYDDSYARNMWAPGTNCAGAPGAEMQYFENLDRTVNDLIPLFTSIDPSNLPLAMVNGVCTAVPPHKFLLTNTIFNVADAANLYTAWSDKHPAYDIVNGPSGDGVNDLFTPEINTTAVPDPTTVSVAATDAYDQLKVQAVLNEIDGKTSDGKRRAPVPAIFGMNFQSVSVGQKLVNPVLACSRNPTSTCDPTYFPGGYEPGSLAFTPQMTQAMAYVDSALGSMADELREKGLSESTELIISAKHGQSPIDPTKLHKIGDAVSPILAAAGVTIGENTEDDVSLIWLKDQHQTAAAVKALAASQAGANPARIQTILSGDALADQFGDPLKNNRTPDIIVEPIPGTIYTTSAAKVAEHGGFSADDTHVALLVVTGAASERNEDDAAHGRTISSAVHTRQIAPSILQFLGLNPDALQSVRAEGTATLP